MSDEADTLTFERAIVEYVLNLDPHAIARLVRDEIAEHTGRLALAYTPPSHPSLRSEAVIETAATLADYAELAVACTLERIAAGISLASVVR